MFQCSYSRTAGIQITHASPSKATLAGDACVHDATWFLNPTEIARAGLQGRKQLLPAYPKDRGKTKITAISFAILRAVTGKKDKLLGIQRPETQARDWRAVRMKTEVAQTCINSTTLERRVSCTFVNYRSKKGELDVAIFFLREKNIAGHLILDDRGASEEKGNLSHSH